MPTVKFRMAQLIFVADCTRLQGMGEQATNENSHSAAYVSSILSRATSTSRRIASERRDTPAFLAQLDIRARRSFGNRTAETGPISGRPRPRILRVCLFLSFAINKRIRLFGVIVKPQ
jgi:hypothetical protein